MTQMVARRTATVLLRDLPPEKLRVAVDFLTYLHTKEEWDATLEILQSPILLQSLKRGREDLRRGRWVRWQDVRRGV